MNEKEYVLKTNQVAELLNVSDQTVRNYCEKFGLPFVRLPSGHKRFCEADILAFRDRFNAVEDKPSKVLATKVTRHQNIEVTDMFADSVEF